MAYQEEMSYFSLYLRMLGYKLVETSGKGNGFFEAIADQICGDMERHMEYRKTAVKYMKEHRTEFEKFLDEKELPFDQYVDRLACFGELAGQMEIKAVCEAFKVNIMI